MIKKRTKSPFLPNLNFWILVGKICSGAFQAPVIQKMVEMAAGTAIQSGTNNNNSNSGNHKATEIALF